jgi:NAD(P)-dependent dehydrogenase (short-subunit alcohol dehydrogenase family)
VGRLQDKVAVITGAGQGIGLADAERVHAAARRSTTPSS